MEKKIHQLPAESLHTVGTGNGKKVEDSFVNEMPAKIAGLGDLQTVATSVTGTDKLRTEFDSLTLTPKNY